jgi:preprotein translocase subunit SecF
MNQKQRTKASQNATLSRTRAMLAHDLITAFLLFLFACAAFGALATGLTQ